MNRWVFLAAILALMGTPSMAQTPSPTSTGPRSLPPPPPLPASGAASAPATPIPAATVKQAEAHSRGEFSAMKRASVGGQVQEAWDSAGKEAGVFKYAYCPDCTYKVRLREHMVTTIELPAGEVFEKADVGDPDTFKVESRGKRRLAVKAAGFGVDTNLIVYSKSGAIYPIYLRLESYNSKNVPDLLVRIEGHVPSSEGAAGFKVVDGERGDEVAPPISLGKEVADLRQSPSPPPPGDFVKNAPFDADTLRGWGEYKLWGGGNYVEDLKPETVFRDDHFTYVRFGEKWKDIELPTAYVVVDGIDELVNTRVQGRTYIIESTRRLITLKSGSTFICIQYTGAK